MTYATQPPSGSAGSRGAGPARAAPDTTASGTVAAISLLDRLSVGAALIDHDGIVRWCNPAFGALQEIDVESVMGRPIASLHGDGDNPYDHPDAVRLESDDTAEYRFERPHGQRHLSYVLRSVPGDDPLARRWYMLEVAATAEPPLVRAGPFAEAALDDGGRIVTANDSFARLVGERAHRLPGRPLIDLVAARDVDAVQRVLRHLALPASSPDTIAAGENSTTIEVHLARNDTRPSWAEFAMSSGSRRTTLVRARDVTERKRDELLLTEVFDASPLPYALISADATVHSANPTWRAQFGDLDTVGRNLADLLGEEGKGQLETALAACIAGRMAGFELMVLIESSPAGPFLARLRATALHDLSNRMDRLLVSLEDLTEHALEVEVARRSASHVRATLDEIDLAVVVHDLDGQIRELNLGAHRLFGSDAADLVGHAELPSWWQPRCTDGSPLPAEDHPAQRVLGDGAPRAEAIIGLRIGNAGSTEAVRWYVVRARALTDETLRHRIGAVVTYTEVTVLQDELARRRAEQFAAHDTFDSLPVAVYETGRDFIPTRVSAALAELAQACERRPQRRSNDSASPMAAGAAAEPSRPFAEHTDGTPDRGQPDPDLDPGSGLDEQPDPVIIDLRTAEPAGRPRNGAAAATGAFAVCDLFSLVHRDDRRAAADCFSEAAQRQTPVRFHHRLADAPGAPPRWVDHQINPLVVDGTVEGYLGVLIPVPDWVAHGDRTRRIVRLVETTNDLVGEFDLEAKRITYLNPRAIEVFEADERRLERLRLSSLYGPDADVLFRSAIWPALLKESRWEGELPMIRADGSTIHVQQWITAERDPDGRIARVVAVGHDVTDRSQREAELALRATHDALTGLPNRTLLLERLDAALGRARRTNRLVGLAFLDLDRFKLINDRYGHDGGDTLLVQVANRLSSVLRPTDLVARLGGDEFVVLCDGVDDKSHALAIANRVSVALGARPYSVNGATVRVTASLGLALSAGAEHPEALLRDADAALYRAKDAGRARIELFDETMRSRANSRVLLAEELRASLTSGAIAVHYQPSIDLRTGEVRAVEALARWEHPTRGLLQPSDFIEVAESTGLLAELGEQVLREAVARAHSWEQRFGAAAPSIHVNLSSRQIVDTELLDTVQAVLSSTGLRPSLLCLELTESVLLEDSDRAIGTVRDLKALGVRLAIDDFGTGYSSLSYLSRLPVDVVKIDRSFVEELDPSRPNSSVVAAAIVSLAHALGLSSIAEGVATVTQLAELHRLGCDAAQGFYFSPPLDSDAIDTYLVNRLQRSRGLETTGA